MLICPVSEIQSFQNQVTLSLTFQGHQQLKVMMSNEIPYMTSYETLIATICLSGAVSEIQPFNNVSDLEFDISGSPKVKGHGAK